MQVLQWLFQKYQNSVLLPALFSEEYNINCRDLYFNKRSTEFHQLISRCRCSFSFRKHNRHNFFTNLQQTYLGQGLKFLQHVNRTQDLHRKKKNKQIINTEEGNKHLLTFTVTVSQIFHFIFINLIVVQSKKFEQEICLRNFVIN